MHGMRSRTSPIRNPWIPSADLALIELLAPLDGDVRRAMYLHAQGYKARSKSPDEPTISRMLGVTDRTVRTYLREGERILRARALTAGTTKEG